MPTTEERALPLEGEPATMTDRPVPGQRPRQRAQAMVEFALIMPLLFTLLLGIIEFGWLFRSHMTLHYATREAAHTGAVIGNSGQADDIIMSAISVTMKTMSYDGIQQVRIYKAKNDGSCVNPCQEDVWVYDATTSTGWNQTVTGWPPGGGDGVGRKDKEPTDVLGVEITYTHTFLSNFIVGLIGSATLRDHSVMVIEPIYFADPPTPTPIR